MRQLGMSMLEMLLVIAIGAAIITISIRYYNVTERNLSITQATNQIHMLTKASYDWLSAQHQASFCDGECISLNKLTESGLIPNNKHYTETPWGTNIIIGPANNNSYVEISFALPKEDCDNLQQRLRGINEISNACSSGGKTTTFHGAF